MRTIAIVAAMLVTLAANAQQRVSKYFSNESLSKVLVELDGLSKGQHISFVYNELEDFVVTTSVEGKTLLDAVKQVVGFYPMEITVKDGELIDGVFHIYDFEFTAFALIGVAPCFESSLRLSCIPSKTSRNSFLR